MRDVNLSYIEFKDIVSRNKLFIQYQEHLDSYELFAIDGSITWNTIVLKDSIDSSDFENNYKPTSNSPQILIVGGRECDSNEMKAVNVETAVGCSALHTFSIPGTTDFVLDNKKFSVNIEDNLLTSTSENTIFLIKNPNTNAKYLYINKFTMNVITKGGQAEFRLYVNPTVTNPGTSYPVTNDLIGSDSVSTMLVTYLPVVSSMGTKIRNLSAGANANSLVKDFNLGVVLPPNNSLLITGQPDANNRVVGIDFSWVEA